MNIKNSVVLVTGSSDRVGRVIAIKLAEKGARVIVHYFKNKSGALETAKAIEQHGSRPLILNADISRRSDWIEMRDAILESHGRLDVLVNNAAIFYKTPFFKIRDEDWDSFMGTNLKSVFLGCQVLGQLMVAQKKGKIINIADVSGYRIWKDYIPYCLSKAGVISLTRGLAKALAPEVLVNAVAPGTVLLARDHDPDEERRLIERTPLKTIGKPEDIASAVVFLIEGSDFITGEIINVDGGRSLV